MKIANYWRAGYGWAQGFTQTLFPFYTPKHFKECMGYNMTNFIAKITICPVKVDVKDECEMLTQT